MSIPRALSNIGASIGKIEMSGTLALLVIALILFLTGNFFLGFIALIFAMFIDN